MLLMHHGNETGFFLNFWLTILKFQLCHCFLKLICSVRSGRGHVSLYRKLLHQMDLRILSYDSVFCVRVSIPFLVSPIKNIKFWQSHASLMMLWKINLTLWLVSVVGHLQYVRLLYYVISKYLCLYNIPVPNKYVMGSWTKVNLLTDVESSQ